MTHTSIQQIFGLIPATVDRYITSALIILEDLLKERDYAKIIWPSEAQMVEYGALILQRHPMLVEAFGSLDGLKLPVPEPNDPGEENALFNSWVQGISVALSLLLDLMVSSITSLLV